ncbi:MAG: hypothetical protein U5N58_10965 [Actinomycetota bacterium]|nr:hypothetical protein [Actinomycetota bacterium]
MMVKKNTASLKVTTLLKRLSESEPGDNHGNLPLVVNITGPGFQYVSFHQGILININSKNITTGPTTVIQTEEEVPACITHIPHQKETSPK